MSPAPFVDASGTLRAWLNTLTTDLVGPGKPLALGVHFNRLRSPARGAYALLSQVGTPEQLTEETLTCQSRISASIYGMTKASAALAAKAYANALLQITTIKPVVGGVQIHTVDGISGPLEIPDGDEIRFLVDADVFFTATASVPTH